jgi:hypothetical protein
MALLPLLLLLTTSLPSPTPLFKVDFDFGLDLYGVISVI